MRNIAMLKYSPVLLGIVDLLFVKVERRILNDPAPGQLIAMELCGAWLFENVHESIVTEMLVLEEGAEKITTILNFVNHLC